MHPTRIDAITRLFVDRKHSRRQPLATAAGLGAIEGVQATAAQEASPAAEPAPSPTPPTMLFVQSYQSGSIVPSDAAEGRYTITLEQGLGETIYFSDRPDRIVGAFQTDAFTEWLGFPADNPPNAAILTQNPDGTSTIAVVELFAPVYDTGTANMTYDVALLDHWQDGPQVQFGETPVDLAAVGASFGTSHLFIDGIADCPDDTMMCRVGMDVVGIIDNADHDGYCYSLADWACFPCQPWSREPSYWTDQCNQRFEACEGDCWLQNFCSRDAPLGIPVCGQSDSHSSFGW